MNPVLDSLEQKGFIQSQAGMPKIFCAVKPDIALHQVLENREQGLTKLRQNAKQVINSLSQVQQAPEKTQELVETYFGHSTAFARSIVLHQQAKTYWKTISKLTLKKEHLESCKDAIARGVTIQALTSLTETTPERIAQWTKIGVQVRLLDHLPFRVSMYDDKAVIFRFAHEKEYVCTHIQNNKLTKGMSKMFDEMWEKSKPFENRNI